MLVLAKVYNRDLEMIFSQCLLACQQGRLVLLSLRTSSWLIYYSSLTVKGKMAIRVKKVPTLKEIVKKAY